MPYLQLVPELEPVAGKHRDDDADWLLVLVQTDAGDLTDWAAFDSSSKLASSAVGIRTVISSSNHRCVMPNA